MRITVVLKSGIEFEVNCSGFKFVRDRQGKVIGIDISGITGKRPPDFELSDVAKIVQKAPY